MHHPCCSARPFLRLVFWPPTLSFDPPPPSTDLTRQILSVWPSQRRAETSSQTWPGWAHCSRRTGRMTQPVFLRRLPAVPPCTCTAPPFRSLPALLWDPLSSLESSIFLDRPRSLVPQHQSSAPESACIARGVAQAGLVPALPLVPRAAAFAVTPGPAASDDARQVRFAQEDVLGSPPAYTLAQGLGRLVRWKQQRRHGFLCPSPSRTEQRGRLSRSPESHQPLVVLLPRLLLLRLPTNDKQLTFCFRLARFLLRRSSSLTNDVNGQPSLDRLRDPRHQG